MEVGALRIDPRRREATVGGRQLDLRAREFDLLAALARDPGVVLTRDALLEDVWGTDFPGETRTVDVHVARGPPEARRRRAARSRPCAGVGYRLVPPGPRAGPARPTATRSRSRLRRPRAGRRSLAGSGADALTDVTPAQRPDRPGLRAVAVVILLAVGGHAVRGPPLGSHARATTSAACPDAPALVFQLRAATLSGDSASCSTDSGTGGPGRRVRGSHHRRRAGHRPDRQRADWRPVPDRSPPAAGIVDTGSVDGSPTASRTCYAAMVLRGPNAVGPRAIVLFVPDRSGAEALRDLARTLPAVVILVLLAGRADRLPPGPLGDRPAPTAGRGQPPTCPAAIAQPLPARGAQPRSAS